MTGGCRTQPCPGEGNHLRRPDAGQHLQQGSSEQFDVVGDRSVAQAAAGGRDPVSVQNVRKTSVEER